MACTVSLRDLSFFPFCLVRGGGAEDISLALEEQSLAGLQRIPRAVHEIDRVENDTVSLQSKIQGEGDAG